MALKNKAYVIFLASFLGTVAFGLYHLALVVKAAQGI